MHYDKWILCTVLFSLIATLTFIDILIDKNAEENAHIDQVTATTPPKYPRAAPVNTSDYREIVSTFNQPFQAGPKTRKTMGPEPRIPCGICLKPIELQRLKERKECLFCGAVPPPPPEDLDEDMDSMWDGWEIEMGLDPTYTDDAVQDPDEDGYSNIEEFTARSNPLKADHSPLHTRFFLNKMMARPFPLVFDSVIEFPNGAPRFGLNDSSKSGQTHFVGLGDVVNGFTVLHFEHRIVERKKFGMNLKVDASVLTLQKGDQLIHLERSVPRNEYWAEIEFEHDQKTFTVTKGQLLKIRDKIFDVTEIQPKNRTVSIRHMTSGEEIKIQPRKKS